MSEEKIKAKVIERYGSIASGIREKGSGSCCGPTPPEKASCDTISGNLYQLPELAGIPAEAVQASLGCGNPVMLAELKPGQIVLDLGAGGGIDVLLSAKRVGPGGKAYGLDMTDEMLELARWTAPAAGVTNVEFLKGEIERIPLPNDSVDVIISNCVINLSAEKPRVLREAFRVLRPGGRLAVSDVVVRGPVPEEIRRSLELWVGCVAGALEVEEFERLLREVGFEDPSIEP